MRLNRLVNHGELNDTTDTGDRERGGGEREGEELQVLTDYYNTVVSRY